MQTSGKMETVLSPIGISTCISRTSDNTDPRLNGRSYRYSVAAKPATWIVSVGYAAGLLALAGVALAIRTSRWQRFSIWPSAVLYKVGLLGLLFASTTLAILVLLLTASLLDDREVLLHPNEISNTKGHAFRISFVESRTWPFKSVTGSASRLIARVAATVAGRPQHWNSGSRRRARSRAR